MYQTSDHHRRCVKCHVNLVEDPEIFLEYSETVCWSILEQFTVNTMPQPRFSLSWEAYKSNICEGLSSFQQNGEFVDMTLAADGHLVKVHQVIVALASPYIKDLISVANCQHPVIFFNNVSYHTLCSILEYIYTGEVMVSMDNLNEFITAAQNLHIKGLNEVDLYKNALNAEQSEDNAQNIGTSKTFEDSENIEFEVVGATDDDIEYAEIDYQSKPLQYSENEQELIYDYSIDEATKQAEQQIKQEKQDTTRRKLVTTPKVSKGSSLKCTLATKTAQESTLLATKPSSIQYTVSNQGSLQMILNRFMYYLKHSNKDNTRYWRCVDYVSHIKCPALIITQDEVVLKRISAHTHPFHDQKILKKLRNASVFSALQEAERLGASKKQGGKTNE